MNCTIEDLKNLTSTNHECNEALKEPFSHILYDSHPRNTSTQQMIRFRSYNFSSDPDIITVYLTKC